MSFSYKMENKAEKGKKMDITARSDDLKVPPRKAKRHHAKESWIDETGRRSDPTRNETSRPALRTPGTGAETTPEARGSS